jgi:hypothetical protein
MGHGPTLLTCIHDQPLEDLVSGDSPKDLLLKISKIQSATSTILQLSIGSKGVVIDC